MLTGRVAGAVGRTVRTCVAVAALCIVAAPVFAGLCADGTSASVTANRTDLGTATRIALGTAPITDCPGLDADGNRSVTLTEILDGVSVALQRGAGEDGGSATSLVTPVIIEVGTAWGSADEIVSFNVRLNAPLSLVAAAQVDINFDPITPIPAHPNPMFGGAPFCDVNPAINKDQSVFAFNGVNRIRGIILSLFNLDVIPDGAVLFSCHVHINSAAAIGTYPLPCSNAQSATPGALALPTTCTPGAIVVIAPTVIDHYKCYQGSDLKNPKFNKQAVLTTDQLTTNDPMTVLNLKYICTPVDKNGEGIADPSAHLACYGVKARAFDVEPRALVSTQFQATQFQLKKPKLLCVPATKTILP